MLVIFATFIVFPEGDTTRASMIKDSITVWLVKGSRGLEVDYHGHFNSGKFEELFQKLCITLEQYGNCIIHMDGASYHKRRDNDIPSQKDKKEVIKSWLIRNGHLREKGRASTDGQRPQY